jgi:NAD(P)-dependent dehydrogenase (short-subunit alcohol dehydrogenase family)
MARQLGRPGELTSWSNNAGIIRTAPVDSLELADFDLPFAVNVRGAFVSNTGASLNIDGTLAGRGHSRHSESAGQLVSSFWLDSRWIR